MTTTERRVAQIVVERTSGDVYITHNLDQPVFVSYYDWDAAEDGRPMQECTDAEVTVGQQYVDTCHEEWDRARREQEQADDLYDSWKDYWNDRGPDTDDDWSD